MEFVFAESRWCWKPVIQPFATSPLSGMLKGSDRLGISGNRHIRLSLTMDKLACP